MPQDKHQAISTKSNSFLRPRHHSSNRRETSLFVSAIAYKIDEAWEQDLQIDFDATLEWRGTSHQYTESAWILHITMTTAYSTENTFERSCVYSYAPDQI